MKEQKKHFTQTLYSIISLIKRETTAFIVTPILLLFLITSPAKAQEYLNPQNLITGIPITSEIIGYSSESVTVLLLNLGSDDALVRKNAKNNLDKIGEWRVKDMAFKELLENTQKLPAAVTLEILTQLLGYIDPMFHIKESSAIIQLIGSHQYQGAVEILSDILQSPNHIFWQTTAQALLKIESPESISVVLETLYSSDRRRDIINALENQPAPLSSLLSAQIAANHSQEQTAEILKEIITSQSGICLEIAFSLFSLYPDLYKQTTLNLLKDFEKTNLLPEEKNSIGTGLTNLVFLNPSLYNIIWEFIAKKIIKAPSSDKINEKLHKQDFAVVSAAEINTTLLREIIDTNQNEVGIYIYRKNPPAVPTAIDKHFVIQVVHGELQWRFYNESLEGNTILKGEREISNLLSQLFYEESDSLVVFTPGLKSFSLTKNSLLSAYTYLPIADAFGHSHPTDARISSGKVIPSSNDLNFFRSVRNLWEKTRELREQDKQSSSIQRTGAIQQSL